jgi:hypothetical protein
MNVESEYLHDLIYVKIQNETQSTRRKQKERIKEAENFDKSLSSPDTLPTRYGDKRKFHLPLTKVERQQCFILIMIYG